MPNALALCFTALDFKNIPLPAFLSGWVSTSEI